MPQITFMPLNRTVEVNPGLSILDAAIDHDIPLDHACGGYCACTTCHVLVRSGAENLSGIEEEEEERLDRATGVTLQSRLGCQATILKGNITVEIPSK